MCADTYKHLEEVLFEFQPIGRSVKVTAIDAKSGVEISIVGPVNAGRHELERIAMRKLDYVLQKRIERGADF